MTDRDPFAPLDQREEEDLASRGAEHELDADGDDEIVMPIPEHAESLRQALGRDWGRKPSSIEWYCDREGNRSFAVVRFDDANGKNYYTFCWVRSATGEGWKLRSVPAPRPLFNLNVLAAKPDAPVLVVEGEKCARAAEKVFPDWVVVTSMGGALAAEQTDWMPMQNRQVMIFPDADEPGTKYANNVATKLDNLGVSNFRVVDAYALASRMPDGTTREPPLGWDVADAVEEGWNLDVLREAVLANAKGFEVGPQFVSFGNFAMDADGLSVTIPKGNGEIAMCETKWVCAPFEILGRARDPKGEGWARLIRWQDDDGRVHTDTISDEDLHGDVSALCARLAHCGLRIGTGKYRQHLIGYLNDSVVKDRVTVVTRTGWHDLGEAKAFALPDETIGLVAGERVILQGAPATTFESKGTLADWQNSVGSLVADHSRGEFAVSVAFAGPVLGLLGQQGVGFNLYGQSSCGKTTTVEAAASVWGKGASPGFVLSWRSTANALEAAAAIHTDTLFVLDELGVVEAKEAAMAVYQLTSGTGKKRLKRDSTPRPSLTWRTMVLSTGEMRMADKLIEGNLRARAGQQVRLIDIPADAGMGFGVFSHAGPDDDAKALADALKTAARTSYGTAGPEFVRRLIANGIDKSTATIEATINTFQKHAPPNADGQVLRVCNHFGLVAAAGELAREFGVVHWRANAAVEAARQCFADWFETRGGAEAGEVQAAIAQVRLFIEQHGDSRFESIGTQDRPVNNRAGWRKGDGSEREWLIPPETWKVEVARGHDSQLVARVLADHGMLRCGNDGGLTHVMKIQGKSTRGYVVKASILAGTDNE